MELVSLQASTKQFCMELGTRYLAIASLLLVFYGWFALVKVCIATNGHKCQRWKVSLMHLVCNFSTLPKAIFFLQCKIFIIRIGQVILCLP